MQVIFIKDHKNGKINEIKDVADGFAKNSLIPSGVAIQATPENIRELKRKQAQAISDAKVKREKLMHLVEKIESTPLTIFKEATPMGIPNGVITHSEIASEFKKVSGIDIDKKDIKTEKISDFGSFKVKVSVGDGLFAFINLSVKSI